MPDCLGGKAQDQSILPQCFEFADVIRLGDNGKADIETKVPPK